MHARLAAEAGRRPDAVAVSGAQGALSFGELLARARGLAWRLRALGVGPEVLVAVCAGSSLERVTAVVAVLIAGGAYVSLSASEPPERLAWLLGDAAPAVVLTERRIAGLLPDSPAGAAVICLDEKIASPRSGESHAASVTPPASGVSAANLAYVIYTSGSTGRPKGVAISHAGLVNLVRWHQDLYAVTAADRATLMASPAFDASVWELWPYLCAGASVHIAAEEARLSAAAMMDWWAREAITLAFAMTPLAELGLEQPAPSVPPLALRALLVGGDRLHRGPAADCRFRLMNHYGPSECSVVATAGEVPPEAPAAGARHRLPPIGRPIANTRTYVLDRDLEPVPVGVLGELFVAGAGLARGYLGRPDLTAERFLPFPGSMEPGARMYRTGDRVRWLADGELDFVGRSDDQIKVRGVRIELGEIEAALRAESGVAEAVVTAPRVGAAGGLSDERRLTAYVVPAAPPAAMAAPGDEARRLIARLRQRLAARLPAPMVPAAWMVLDRLPLTSTGKVDRRALPVPEAGAGIADTDETTPPRTPEEELLAALWAEVLGRERIGPASDFLALGGHSLLLTQLASRVRSVFRVEVPLTELFEVRTLAQQAERIAARRRRGEGPEALPIERRTGDGPPPLSFAQERLWVHDQLHPGSPAYNIPVALRLAGELAGAALQRSVTEVVRRHEVLRTVFEPVQGKPLPRVLSAAPVPLPILDLAGMAPQARRRELDRRLEEEALRPFDLATGPLLRATLVRLEGSLHYVLLTQHHIVSDGWSTGVLVREAGALFGAAVAGLPSPLSEPVIQYADYAAWQRRRLSGGYLAEQLGYWREQLADLPALVLEGDRRPAKERRHRRGARLDLALPDPLAASLAELSQRHQVTRFMTVLAAFSTLLGRLAASDDIPLGATVANRNHLEIEQLIGFFVNTLVLRTDLSADPPFAELLLRVRQMALDAYAHEELPIERLVAELHPLRSAHESPLFQVMVAWQNAPLPALELPRLTVSSQEIETGTAKFDLTLILVEQGTSLLGVIEYDLDLFDPATVRRLAGQFRGLLAAVATRPERRLSALPILTAAERHQALFEWSGDPGGSDVPAPSGSLAARFAAAAAARPDAIALAGAEGRLSYRDLAVRSNRLARHLRRLGVKRGDRVCLFLERSPAMVVAILSVLAAGAAYVPLDPTYPDERLRFLLTDSGARLVVTADASAARLVPVLPDGVRLVRACGEEVGRESEMPLAPVAGPGDLAYLIYTSGSTGQPKGVGVTHGNVLRLLDATSGWFGFGSADVWTLFHSYAFDFSVWELWGALAHGGRLVIVPWMVSRSPRLFRELLVHEQVTVLNQTPSAFSQLSREDEAASVRGAAGLVHLRLVIFGGEALELQSLAPWFSRHGDERPRLVNMFGITETTVHVTYRPLGRGDLGAGSRVGRPIPDLSLYLLDSGLEPVPLGAAGEIFVGGAGVAIGYLGRPELTAARFVPDPWSRRPGARLYRSGDLARYRPSGDLEVVGRIDHQVKVRGFRVELGEIEAALADDARVAQALVRGVDDGAGGTRLVAYVVTRAGQRLEPSDLRRALERRLPPYMVPAAYAVLAELPLTDHGKVDLQALPVPDGGPSRRDPDTGRPLTPIEEEVAATWAEVLEREPPGADADFFDLGGHSLLATQVISRLAESFGCDLPLAMLFDRPTVALLGAGIEELLGAGAGLRLPPITPAPRHRILPLSFAQQRLWILDRWDPGSPTYHVPIALRFAGTLDVAALGRAMTALVARHEALRTSFPMREGAPVQWVAAPADQRPPLVDLGALAVPARELETERLVREAAGRPFDLARGPLLRTWLLHLAPAEHVLCLTLHHIAADGWSMSILVRELTALYAGGPELRPLPVQYADFAVWQRQTLAGELLARELDFWRTRLAGSSGFVDLPTDRARPAVRGESGADAPLAVSPAVTAALVRVGRERRATLFMTVLAAYQILLARYSGEDDLVVGCPIAGRDRVETEGLIGFFVNTLVLRADLSGDPSFGELLAQVRQGVLAAYTHRDLPFDLLVESLRPDRDAARTVLFNVRLLFQNLPDVAIELPGLDVRPLPTERPTAEFDLTLKLAADDGRLAGVLNYSTELFDAETVEEMARRFERLLAAVAARPEARLSDLDPDGVALQGTSLHASARELEDW